MVIDDIKRNISLQGLNAQQVADRASLDRKTVAAFLTGENDNPRFSTVQAIAKACGGEVVFQTPDSKSAVTYGDVSYYRTLIANTQNQLEIKDKWIRLLFITCLGLIGINVITDMLCFFCR